MIEGGEGWAGRGWGKDVGQRDEPGLESVQAGGRHDLLRQPVPV